MTPAVPPGEAASGRLAIADAAALNPPDALVVFDGTCSVCSGSVRLALRMDRAGILRFTPTQSRYGRLLCAAAGVDPADPSTFLFFDRGRALGGSDGIAALFARLKAPWRWLRLLRAVPRPAREGAYRWIARNRYRLRGRTRVCMVPPPGLRHRFIDVPPPG